MALSALVTPLCAPRVRLKVFSNLLTGKPLWQVPPRKRIRMAHEKFRRLLMDDVDINASRFFRGFSAVLLTSFPSGSTALPRLNPMAA